MKKYFIIIISSFLVAGITYAFTPATLFIETWNGIKKQAVYSQEQADKLFKDGYHLYQGDMLGTSITTINGTDTLKDSRTTINNNFTALNSGKIEVGTSSVASITTLSNLTTVGTIGSGIWRGNAVEVGYGGTGTTSPSRYQVILGNGSSGLTVASSTGISGQFLTSNGANAYPSWQTSSIDQAANYTWTGTHTFATTTVASTTITTSINFATSTQFGINGGLSPTGSITAYATSTAPAGWLLCNGSSLATASYPNLFAVIGYYYGGSGANFTLPDLRGRNILMASSTPNIGQTGGESNHTMTTNELVAHTHVEYYGDTSGSGGIDVGQSDGSPIASNISTGSTGSTVPFNVLDPYIVLNYIIKY